MHLHEQLMEETIQADASMLLEYMVRLTREGIVRPISVREALEAIHRPQPAEMIPQEAAHANRVMALVRSLLLP